ncbi:nucleotide cyclase [Zopfochytrium polystomum]|nr:nucleotide cyclase [Zopfochytrium polystomum]
MVVSIVGFNRIVNGLGSSGGGSAPAFLLDLMRRYYATVEECCVDGNAGAVGARKTVHIVDRVCDTCVLVSGTPDRNEAHAEDVVDTAERLIQRVGRWDKILSFEGRPGTVGDEGRVRLRIGIHSGPVTAGIVNVAGTPRFTVVGETVNLATAIQALAPSMEIRVSASTQALLEAAGYITERRQEADLRTRGKLGTFAVLATPFRAGGEGSGEGTAAASTKGGGEGNGSVFGAIASSSGAAYGVGGPIGGASDGEVGRASTTTIPPSLPFATSATGGTTSLPPRASVAGS